MEAVIIGLAVNGGSIKLGKLIKLRLTVRGGTKKGSYVVRTGLEQVVWSQVKGGLKTKYAEDFVEIPASVDTVLTVTTPFVWNGNKDPVPNRFFVNIKRADGKGAQSDASMTIATLGFDSWVPD